MTAPHDRTTIRLVLDIAAPPESVFSAITTVDGLAAWWTTQVRAEEATLECTFRGAFSPRMQVAECVSPTRVRWEGRGGHDAWGATDISFTLAPMDGGTRVRFEQHVGNDRSDDAVAGSTFNWAYYLDSLRLLCETGRGKPYPAGMAGARVGADTRG